ncbi:MAG: SGNH/GDSL hydrolase family protein [Gemmatimonadaceae bacterium]
MTRFNRFAAGCLVLGAVACKVDKVLVTVPDNSNGLLKSYVALGNSITAGLQSGGINDSTQRESYAFYLAQAAGVQFQYPSLAMPGCPPPIVNAITQARLPASAPCALRDRSKFTPVLNNVAVPGARSLDPLSLRGNGVVSKQLTTFILGGRTQVQRALEASPTFVTVWIGNNDLLPTTQGYPTLSTTPATFIASYKAAINALVGGAPRLKGGVLIGAIDLSIVPLFFPSGALQDPAFKGGFDALAGQTTAVDPSCATPDGQAALISIELAGAIRGGAPPVIACTPIGGGVGDTLVLDIAKQAQSASIVAAYNAYIKAKADSVGFAYFDPNPPLAQLKVAGQISTVPNLASTTQTFGSYMSLDGFHPGRLAHQTLANSLIGIINQKYGTTLTKIAVR